MKKAMFLFFIPCLWIGPKEYTVRLIQSETIFQQAPFKACHAATITSLPGNTFMAAWFGGSSEGAPDVGIWISKLSKGQWSAPQEIASSLLDRATRLPCWNPVLFKGRNGWVYLFYKQGKNPREWSGKVMISKDLGISWSPPRDLPNGFLGPVKNKPVQLQSGEILCPSSTESLDQKLWKVHLEITDDSLKSWKRIELDSAGSFGVIQPTILQYPGDKLQLLCRSRQNCIVQSWSTDDGQHWSTLRPTTLLNPNSGIDGVSLKNGLQILVYNPTLQGNDWMNGRNILKVAVSEDGLAWQDVYTLENQKSGEYSYPAVIQDSSGLVHIVYTADRTNIRHVVLDIEKHYINQ